MAIEYGLGTTAANIKFLGEMSPALPCPESSIAEWGAVYVNADGTYTGDGFPSETWTFPILNQEQVNVLKVYVGAAFGNASANVYLSTRLPNGEWDVFTAVMQWPNDIASRRDMVGVYRGVSITFSQLEVT